MPPNWGLLVAIILLIILSAFFSASETAYSSVSSVRVRVQEGEGVKWAKRVAKQLEHYDKLLTTILVGNNIVNIVLASISTVFFAALITNSSLSVTVSTAVTTVAVLIFGEITPKALAKEHPEGFLRFCSLPIFALSIVLYPLCELFSLWKKLMLKIFRFKNQSSITEDELLTYVEDAHRDGGIDEHETKLIQSAIEFEDLDVGDIMVHRTSVISVADDTPPEQIEPIFFEHGYSRLPVYHDTIDTIVGILHEKDFYHARGNISDIRTLCGSTVCLSMNMKISAALRMMQKTKIHMAVVVDEYGGTAGIITLEDILEELVGEIYDEHDEEEGFMRQTGENVYLVQGSAPLINVFERLDVDDPDDFESSTVGGWVTEEMEKIPLVGETFDFKNLSIKVTKATQKRVVEVEIEVLPADEE